MSDAIPDRIRVLVLSDRSLLAHADDDPREPFRQSGGAITVSALYVRADALAAAEAREREARMDALAASGQAQEAYEAQKAAEAETAALRAKLEAVREALTVRRSVQCRRCLGFGTVAYFGEAVTCGECGGTGRIPTKAEDAVVTALALLDAPAPQGEGE